MTRIFAVPVDESSEKTVQWIVDNLLLETTQASKDIVVLIHVRPFSYDTLVGLSTIDSPFVLPTEGSEIQEGLSQAYFRETTVRCSSPPRLLQSNN